MDRHAYPVVLVNVSREMNQIQFPIGLSVLANSLKRHGIPVRVLDLIPVPAADRDRVFEEAAAGTPGIYGFGIILGGYHLDEVERMAAILRRVSPGSLIVYGGSFPSSMPDLMLRNTSCDYLVHGEGERTFPALIQALERGERSPADIAGVFFRRGDEIVGTRNRRLGKLDAFSNPDFDLFDMDYYLNYLKETGQSWEIMASRGCKGDCSFCYKFMGNGLSLRRVDDVLDEIEHVVRRYDLPRFYFVDENFLQIKKYVREFIAAKDARGLDFSFVAQSRIDDIDEEKCALASANGLVCITTGIESVSQRTLDSINKRISVKDAEAKLALMRRYGIKPSVALIMGFPWETEADYEDMYDFIVRNGLQGHVKLSYLTPLPATRLFEEVCAQGIIQDPLAYARRLNNLYWERFVNLTGLPDDVLDHHYRRITDLGKRSPVVVKSESYLKQIRELH